MEKVIEKLSEDLSLIRSDRATPALVENLPVEAYGSKLTIKEVAAITSPDSRQLVIQPWDKEILNQLESALERFNPRIDGDVLRVTLPSLTDERKEELEKEVNQKCEEARIAVRRNRDKERDDVKKDPDENTRYRKFKELDDESEKINKQIEEMRERKAQEICS
jgi:ribosome recycling factor